MRERLASRGARFATIDSSYLAGLGDGATLAVWPSGSEGTSTRVEAILHRQWRRDEADRYSCHPSLDVHDLIAPARWVRMSVVG